MLKDDTEVLNKMNNELTTGAWKDDISCPINIILGSTSDVGATQQSTNNGGTWIGRQ
jgi:hypothetical protein